MPDFCFHIKANSSVDDAWQELMQLAFTPLYSSEEPAGRAEIVATVHGDIESIDFKHIESYNPVDLSIIDWESQWALHGLNFRDGYVHLNCSGIELRLKPGPGFGDMSHPTTRLTIEMMKEIVKDKNVLDIGCGSGVLSLAAVALGAHTTFGIDIDKDAILHSQTNAQLNNMESKLSFGFAQDIPCESFGNIVVLMNMIQSEQVEAWNSVKQVHKIPGDCIVSGILKKDRKLYMIQAKKWGWRYCKEIEEEGWLCLLFKR